MPAPAPVMPRQMLPPPTTMATSTPRFRALTTSPATYSANLPSMPKEVSPAKASPESLSRIRLYFASGTGSLSIQVDLGEGGDGGVAEQLGDRLLVVADERLLEEHEFL